ncbi:hypothetical protein JL722_13965 [Aureococcus anophagefferens]|nr:hypothetical protein JL722_13965 [Aureococcus anophagefferens]
MDGAVAYAAVEHVAWEARIGWGESSDEGSEGEPERAYARPRPATRTSTRATGRAPCAGAATASDDEQRRRPAPAPAPSAAASAGARSSVRGAGGAEARARRGRGTIEPAAARRTACPRSSTVPRRRRRGGQALFHRPRLARAPRRLDLAAPRADRAGGAARAALAAAEVAVDADDVATRFAPEDVCAYESANAAAGLRALGLGARLGGPSGAAVAVRALGRRCAAARKRAGDLRARAGAGAAPDDSAERRRRAALQRRDASGPRAKTLERRLGAARRVHEEIGLAPAHLTRSPTEKDGGPAPKAKKGSVKLNISSLMAKHDEHKAEQRRAKEQRMKDDAASYHRRPAPSPARRRARGRAEQAPRAPRGVAQRRVLTPLFRRPAPAGAFFKPVDKKQFPQYYVKITDPVDLTTIKERLGRYVYRARSALLKDLALMAANAAAFNGPAHPIALEGRAMVDAAEAAAADHAGELSARRRSASRPRSRRRGGPRARARGPSAVAAGPRRERAPPLALMGGEDSSSGEEEEMDGGAV